MDREAWWAAVVAECVWRDYAPWFYADPAAWDELREAGFSPVQAVEENLSCLCPCS
jgi:hypothetical protein